LLKDRARVHPFSGNGGSWRNNRENAFGVHFILS
jgi:hypothetical protein